MPPLPDTMTILTALAAVNALTYFLFWYDKRCARRGHWRVAEAALLLFSLIGGSPASFLAMRSFRHKTKKTGFRTRYWLIVILQAGGLVFLSFRHML